MNLQSEIEYFAELAVLDKARLLNSFLHELAQEARTTYGPGTEAVHDTLHLRFVNEIFFRLTRLVEQFLAEDAARPADENHPYGHGRFETLSAFVVGAILAIAGVFISYQSLQAIGARHAPPGAAAAAALVGAIVLRGTMSTIKFRVGRRIRSSALLADAWNDAVDILSATAALIAVGLASLNPERFLSADHYGGFAVGIVVVITGVRVARDASIELVDTMPSVDLTSDIIRVAGTVSGVRGVDKVFARKTGLQYHADLHVEVDPSLTVGEGHAIGGRVRATLKRDLPWLADVLIHVEPSSGEQDAAARG